MRYAIIGLILSIIVTYLWMVTVYSIFEHAFGEVKGWELVAKFVLAVVPAWFIGGSAGKLAAKLDNARNLKKKSNNHLSA